jgi:hypothetical protein
VVEIELVLVPERRLAADWEEDGVRLRTAGLEPLGEELRMRP